MSDKPISRIYRGWSLADLELMVEAVSMFIERGERMAIAFYDNDKPITKDDMLLEENVKERLDNENDGLHIRRAFSGIKFTMHESALLNQLLEVFLVSMEEVEAKIHKQNSEIAKKFLPDLMDDIYKLLDDEGK